MKKTVLITGAAGFLGSHLCDKFIKENYNVIGVDNFITGEKNNINHLIGNDSFQFIEHDIVKPIEIKSNLDYILHFASPASPIDYLKIPLQTLKVGSYGSHNCLELARKNDAKILVASTSEIYGDPLVHPQVEEYYGNVNTVGPRSVYDEAKRYMESVTMAYHTFYNLDISIVRIFNTYGPRMRLNDGRALPTFIGQVLRNEDLTIFGDGSQTRSFCYVDDLISGIYKLLLSDYNKPMNLGNPNEITLLNFAKEIIEFTNSKSKIIFKDLPKDDPKQRKPEISKANKILNWYPKIERAVGLLKTYEYFKNLSNEELNKSFKDFKNIT
jgi:dTDP-glucose 4,6-dehydratase